MHYDCLSIGNSTIDAFLTLPESSHDLMLNRSERMLCVPYGQKIIASSCELLVGGNATNVAVGLRRAGFTAALIAEIANDELSEKIINTLKKERVITDHLVRHKGQSSFSVSLNFEGERTLFVEHRERKHDFDLKHLTTRALYLTSLGNKWEHVYARVAEYVQMHTQTILAFNPGSVQIEKGLSAFSYLLPLTTIFIVNKEEAEKLVKRKGDCKDLLKQLKDKGPQIVVITDGEKGSYCIDTRGSIYHKESIESPSVERTGAGDAYSAGFLAAYLREKPIETCMAWGSHNAASVISSVGAETGLLTQEELEIKT